MNLFAVLFSMLTILVHIIVFVVESFLWLNPLVHERVLTKLNTSTEIELYDQATILELLFFNQGFYNLFVALGGIAGLMFYKMGRTQEGLILVSYTCLFALGASLVLAYSAAAYGGAAVQGLPPLLALLGIYLASRRRAAI